MYTKQGPLFDALTAAGFSQTQVSALRDIFAFCQHDLEQRGQLAILTQRPLGATDGALEVANYPFPPTNEYTQPINGEMPNGWGLNVLYGGIKNNGPFMGGFGWFKASGTWTNTGTAAWDSYVDGYAATDPDGTYAQPLTAIRLYLPRNVLQDPNVRADDVLTYMLGPDGKAYCTSDVLDGKIGEQKDLLSGTPGDYASGLRGWFIANGSNGTVDLSGPLIGYGYTGAGDYATVGNSVSSSFTATLSGNGGTVTSSSYTLTIATHADHSHSVENDSVRDSITVTLESPITTDWDTGADFTGVYWVSAPTVTVNSVVSPSSFATSLPNVALTHTVSSTNPHSHTVSIDSMAAGLTVGSPSANRPAGKVVIRLQRVN